MSLIEIGTVKAIPYISVHTLHTSQLIFVKFCKKRSALHVVDVENLCVLYQSVQCMPGRTLHSVN